MRKRRVLWLVIKEGKPLVLLIIRELIANAREV
jgi:hypothetical protein